MNFLKDKHELTVPFSFGGGSSSPMIDKTLSYLSNSSLLKQRSSKLNQTVNITGESNLSSTNGHEKSINIGKEVSTYTNVNNNNNNNNGLVTESLSLTNNCIVNGFKSFMGINPVISNSTSFYKQDSSSLTTNRDFESPSCSSQFIDPFELKKKLFEISSLSSKFFVILLDCRTYTDFNSKHIKDSVHLNCRDKLTKKRLQSRKLTVKDLISCEEVKSKLETDEPKSKCDLSKSEISDDDDEYNNSYVKNEKKIEEVIVLIDETTSDLNDLQSDSNPLKIVHENIKQSGYKKECKILKGGFKMFSQMCPEFCVLKEATHPLKVREPMPEFDIRQSDIDNAVMTQILPFLYLGNECDAKSINVLEKNEIFYILNVTKNIPFYESNSGKFVSKRIAVNDNGNQNLKDHFEDAFEFIDQAQKSNHKVLVHCQAGISRSPTIVIAYLMKKHFLKFNEAYNKVRDLRPIIAPNLIFMSQLMEYDSKLESLKSINPKSSIELSDIDDDSSSNPSSTSSSSTTVSSSSPDAGTYFTFSKSISNEKSILVM